MATIGEQVAEQVTRIRNEANTQSALIAQITEALGGKAIDEPEPEYPSVQQATPTISVSSGGLITASATQEAGIVPAGTKSATKQLTVQSAQTITPSTSDKTIASGTYLTGTQTIKGDPNLVAGNIKSGTSIFGVQGSLSSGVTVQKKTGSLTVGSNGTATVNVGFKPDAIAFSTRSDVNSIQCSASIMFTESSSDRLSLMHISGDSNAVFAYWIVQRNSSGFYIEVANKVFTDFSTATESNRYVSYTAIKYT